MRKTKFLIQKQIHEVQRRGNISPFALHQTKTNIDIGDYSVPPKTRIVAFIGVIINDPEPSKLNFER